ncbi:helix-turn-helix domain-containing protein [Paraburkholderia atlantica]|uniref:helix-turn-helix domain-containing protein n=1 Tax=Paraburkholderia atlantica TaxID=2654982 RepID=UPI00180AA80D|nr:helix-turn-helix domain-containing protein [Paraburkholderia atlantica]MBB5414901.1 transcriptional regulator GlxA family with amidase domain [Paraburkholderia atlantica]
MSSNHAGNRRAVVVAPRAFHRFARHWKGKFSAPVLGRKTAKSWLRTSDLAQPTDLDALLAPGFWAESPEHVQSVVGANDRLVAMLARLPKTTLVWSYCTGVCLLAAAGKLNRQPATVTWWLMDTMRKQHRSVAWASEQTCVMNKRTGTASGLNGYLPIAQALIEGQVSPEVFRDLSKLMVLPRPERTHQAFQSLHLIEKSDAMLRSLHALVQRLPANDISVKRIAAQLRMSDRTLGRKVLALTGCGVGEYARKIKLDQVSERLIMTSAPASTISAELGFSSDSGMRRMFKDLTALTPSQYRQMFGRS